MIKQIKKIIPVKVKLFLASVYYKLNRLFRYKNYDSSAYWRKRASDPGQAAVLWGNQVYNDLYRNLQREILKREMTTSKENFKVLDIGCGIGVVAKMVTELFPAAEVDAVDFPEMIDVARKLNADERINYIEDSAENYMDPSKKYDVILSSACYSAIRNIDSLKKSIVNGINMLSKDGVIIMIDPFHRWNYLARAKFGSKDVQRLMAQHNMKLINKSGVLFWPYREKLANSKLTGEALRVKFNRGEKLLALLGKHRWADYKILVFKFN